MGLTLSLIGIAFKIVISSLVLLFEGVCWFVVGISNTIHLISEVVGAQRRLSGGNLQCPRGHVVPTEGMVWECESCGFRWQGSVWRCENPECHAITPFVRCFTCRVSVRNPYRYEGSHVRQAGK